MEIKDIEKLAQLARVDLTDEEKKDLLKDTDEILAFVDQIKEVVIEDKAEARADILRNVMREDQNPHESGIFTEDLLAQAPYREENYVKVKKIL